MNARFWRCAIISLLLGALPAQWLAAATTLPCTGHMECALGTATLTLSGQPPATGHTSGVGALFAAYQHSHDVGQERGRPPLADAPSNTVASEVAGNEGAPANPEAKCVSAGHCCLIAALLSTPKLPDFTQRSDSADFAPLTKHHRAPVLGGPERPPRFQVT